MAIVERKFGLEDVGNRVLHLDDFDTEKPVWQLPLEVSNNCFGEQAIVAAASVRGYENGLKEPCHSSRCTRVYFVVSGEMGVEINGKKRVVKGVLPNAERIDWQTAEVTAMNDGGPGSFYTLKLIEGKEDVVVKGVVVPPGVEHAVSYTRTSGRKLRYVAIDVDPKLLRSSMLPQQ